ncbi:MAG: amidohydrolase, partial [Actinobacteria bacterium]|nr:amidohydrolase [Actinomycetota bacterium]
TRPGIDPAATVPGAVEALVGRIWWDAHVGGPRALSALIASVGTDRLVGGTNLAGWDEHPDPSHGDRALAATLDANARSLLRWP